MAFMNPFTQHLVRFFKSYLPSRNTWERIQELVPPFLALVSLIITGFSAGVWSGPEKDPQRQELSYHVGDWALRVFFLTIFFIISRAIYRHIKQRWEDTAL